MLGVYAPYVEETPITFETSVPSEEAFAARMKAVIGDYPYLVVEDAGRIVHHGLLTGAEVPVAEVLRQHAARLRHGIFPRPHHTTPLPAPASSTFIRMGERSVLGADRSAGPAGGAKRLQLGDRSQ